MVHERWRYCKWSPIHLQLSRSWNDICSDQWEYWNYQRNTNATVVRRTCVLLFFAFARTILSFLWLHNAKRFKYYLDRSVTLCPGGQSLDIIWVEQYHLVLALKRRRSSCTYSCCLYMTAGLQHTLTCNKPWGHYPSFSLENFCCWLNGFNRHVPSRSCKGY